MKTYVSGPISGIPGFNRAAFAERAAALSEAGYEVVNPHDLNEKDFDGRDLSTVPWDEFLRMDLRALTECYAISLLDGWQKSKGARLEAYVAHELGLRCLSFVDGHVLVGPVPLPPTPEADPTESALTEAQRLVHGPRQAAYGHPIQDYERTGRLWGAILGLPDIDPRICCLMMAAVKISRETNSSRRDNRVDLAGYAECADMVAQEQERRKRGAA